MEICVLKASSHVRMMDGFQVLTLWVPYRAAYLFPSSLSPDILEGLLGAGKKTLILSVPFPLMHTPFIL